MSQKMKILLMILAAIYVVSPVDVMPGPIDDVIVLLLTIAAQRRSWIREKDAVDVIDVDPIE